MRQVVEALQALRGIAQISAVTIVAEVALALRKGKTTHGLQWDGRQ